MVGTFSGSVYTEPEKILFFPSFSEKKGGMKGIELYPSQIFVDRIIEETVEGE